MTVGRARATHIVPSTSALEEYVDSNGTGASGSTYALKKKLLVPIEAAFINVGLANERQLSANEYAPGTNLQSIIINVAHTPNAAQSILVLYRTDPSATEVQTVGSPESPVSTSRQPVSARPYQEFARIKAAYFADTEEVRYGTDTLDEIPDDLTSQNVYVGVSPAGTAEAATGWTIVRTDFGANAGPSRDRIRFNVVWSARATGWT